MPLTKTKFRQKCLKKLQNAAKQSNKIYKDALVNEILLRELKSKKRLNILFYYPLGLEVDVRKILQKMRKKHNIFIPFMEGKSFKMVPFRLPLRKKKFGVFEAGNTTRNIKKIDKAIVPVVGVDKHLQRVGFGKGMYDRFFAELSKRPYTIFLQRELCFASRALCDDFDVMADMLITPRGIKRK